MSFSFLNRCIWTPTSSGLGDFVVSAAAQHGFTPASCLVPTVVDGGSYHYFATNGAEHEEGDGVYTVSTTTLTRTTIRNSSTGAKVNFSSAPTVFMGGPVAKDMPREIVIADRKYYVATTGSDSNDGLAVGTPFRHIQHAIDVVCNTLDLHFPSNVQIKIADGTYDEFLVFTPFVGNPSSGAQGPHDVYFDGPSLVGNLANPLAVKIQPTDATTRPDSYYSFAVVNVQGLCNWQLLGVEIDAGQRSDYCSLVSPSLGAMITLAAGSDAAVFGNVGAGGGYLIEGNYNFYVYCGTTQVLKAGSYSGLVSATYRGTIDFFNTFTLGGDVTFTYAAFQLSDNTLLVGSINPTLAGHTVTGKAYIIDTNSHLSSDLIGDIATSTVDQTSSVNGETPTIIGGSLASSTLTLESTSGVGTTDYISLLTGSQVEAVHIDTSGFVGIKVGGTGSSKEAYGVYIRHGSDAIDNNGAGTAQLSPTNVEIGQNRNGSLDVNACLYLERSSEGIGGTPPYLYNVNEFAFYAKTFFPLATANINATGAVVTTGGTSAGTHVPQNTALFTSYGFGDTTHEIDAYGGMVHAFLLNTGETSGGAGIFPKYAQYIHCVGAANDSKSLWLRHEGIPHEGDLIRVESPSSFLFQLYGPLDLPNGSITASGGYADLYIRGNIIAGLNSNLALDGAPSALVLTCNGNLTWGTSQFGFGNHQYSPATAYVKTRGASATAHTIVQNNDQIGGLWFYGSDGSAYRNAAIIRCEVDGTPGASDMPGRIVFQVTPDGSATPAEAFRLSNDKTATFSGNAKLAVGTNVLAPLTFQSGTNLSTAADGAMEFDGLSLFFSPDASDRRILPAYAFIRQHATYTLTSQTAAQKIFNGSTNGRVTLPTGVYEFECVVALASMSGTSGNAMFSMVGVGATVTNGIIWWSAIDAAATAAAGSAFLSGYALTATPALSPTNMATATTNTNMFFIVRGTFEVSVAGTVVPSISLTTAATPAVQIGSYFKTWRMGATTDVITGQWD